MKSAAKHKLPPGPVSTAWAGAFKEYSRSPLKYLTWLAREYGDIVTLRYYRFRVYFVSHPEYIEQVLVAQNRKFIKGRILRANKRLFGNGLLTSEGDFWLRQRRLVQPAFHRGRIASYAGPMVRFTERLLEDWKDGARRDIHVEMIRLARHIGAKTLFAPDGDPD